MGPTERAWACDRAGRTLVAEDLAIALGEEFCLLDLNQRLRRSRCGRVGQAETRVSVRDSRRASGWNSGVLAHAIAFVERFILEQREAPALADAIVRTLHRRGIL